MEKYILYKKEKKLMKLSEKILEPYTLNRKEREKKENELFHLLVLFDIKKMKFDMICPHEPGDFIIEVNKKRSLYEVTTAFGEDDNKRIKRILADIRNNNYSTSIILNNEKMMKDFIKVLNEKQKKDYELNTSQKYLLIITGEYDNCPNTGEWFIKLVEKNKLLFNKSFDKIIVLNYNSSGKKIGPTIINDFEEYLKNDNIFIEG